MGGLSYMQQIIAVNDQFVCGLQLRFMSSKTIVCVTVWDAMFRLVIYYPEIRATMSTTTPVAACIKLMLHRSAFEI